ncbi:MAG: hypothetical protein LBR83_10455 [Clostridiales bacterium]|nr:hypothetical protein [Clostridiales bacterium]
MGALIFVQKYGVYDMEAFADRIIRIHQERYDLAAEIQKKERRISKLNEHLANVDAHKKHQDGRDRIPEKEWRAGRESLLASRYADVGKYYNLREDIKNAENIRRGESLDNRRAFLSAPYNY